LFGLLGEGVNQNNFFLQGLNKKKNFTGGNLKMTYITGDKDLLTVLLIPNIQPWFSTWYQRHNIQRERRMILIQFLSFASLSIFFVSFYP